MARVKARPAEPKNFFLSDHVFSTDLQETFVKHWHTFSDFKDANLEVITKPFRVCKISNFLRSKQIMDQVKTELLDVKCRRNVVDLYQFEQTSDLGVSAKRCIKMLYKTFQRHLTLWMKRNMKVTLNRKVSMSSSSYYDTDYLLCHDDHLEDRKIAFILYLTDEWSVEDGGALQLLDTDEYGSPRDVVKSLVPEYNSCVFFEVLDNSFHQVAEITSHVKCRWSINGWFHGPMNEYHNSLVIRPIKINFIKPNNKEVQLDSWISEDYLSPNNIEDIQHEVEEKSFSLLKDFLQQDVYNKILADLTSENISWKMVGPADERHYEIADEQTLPQLLRDFYNLFKSISLFRLLKGYTELDLVPMGETMKPKMTIELQRWSTGCYTLISNRMTAEDIVRSKEKAGLSDQYDDVDQNDNIDHDDVDTDEYNDVNQDGDIDRDADDENSTDSENCDGQSSIDREESFSERTTPSIIIPRDDVVADTNEVYREIMKRKHSSPPRPPQSPSMKLETPTKILRKDDELYFHEFSEPSSDIEDYLSHNSDDDSADNIDKSGTLDLIMQFHISKATDADDMIDYIDPNEPDGELIHVPTKENHLCLVYKTSNICRLHRYVNHYCKGYFYNLICTYQE